MKSLPKTYSIHDRIGLENALEVLDAMAGHKLNAEQQDHFEALSTLVEAYERQHVPAPKLTGTDLLRHLVEVNEMSGADLARLLGCDRSLGVRLLSGERQLTIQHIKTLSDRFGVPPQLFL
jgi:HTH-type transcriptional regulator / antitoxin HigA